MFASALLYLGLIAIVIGALSVIVPLAFLGVRRRGTGLRLLVTGLAMVVVSVVLPTRELHVGIPQTELDHFVPVYQFYEVHAVRIDASSDRIDRAIRSVTADEIALFHALTWMRRLGRPGPESILNAPGDKPLLDVAMRSGFMRLADVPRREIVLGTLIVAPPGWRPPSKPTPEGFRSLHGPGFGLAAMNFLVEDSGLGACAVTTETRVYATDASTCRRFAAYWRVIYPGSALIRRMWLDAVKRRAESQPPAAGRPRREGDAATMSAPRHPRPGGARG